MLLKKLIAVFMALLIANPACCCAFKAHEKLTQNTRSCCSFNTGDHENKDKESCGCSHAQEKSYPETDFFKATIGTSQLPTQLITSYLQLPKLSESAAFLAKWPPSRLPVPTLGDRLAIKCYFLI